MSTTKDQLTEISRQLKITISQTEKTANLLENGATVPFIARYRKEVTGSLDEVIISSVKELLHKFGEMNKRRTAIIESLNKQEVLTDDLLQKLQTTASLTELEDIYLPFKPKRRTRGAIAREQGLLPLAEKLFKQDSAPLQAGAYISVEKNIFSSEDALAGARDIIAENISEDQQTRVKLRHLFKTQAFVSSRVVKKNMGQAEKFKDYFDWQEPIQRIAGHRILALFRGENQKYLRLNIRPDEEKALRILTDLHLKKSPHQDHILDALQDSYKRLIAPSLENEIRTELKQQADKEAISVFADNLRELLLAPPLGQKRVMALDPGFRTGAKLVCLDRQGQLLHSATIFPTHGEKQVNSASETVRELISKFRIEAIAIGNGTASRETEAFIKNLKLESDIIITLVNEDGASIYSASETARDEFPDHDITVRGAVSIGRRLQDPLAELVKIDPKSIGVGQYQHDVNQADLKISLDEVVSRCVNNVGVELNTASKNLLIHVSGLGPILAANIISWRNTHGPFKNRKQLLDVPRLGNRAFEQAAGFLRIGNGNNPLDCSAVHPERYDIVKKMATDTGATIAELLQSKELRKKIEVGNYISSDVGLPTLKDILDELDKPGRDPRKSFQQFAFAEGISTLEDLHQGMKLPAIITNVTKFGAFADIGVHQDGLIHISQLADRFVKDPSEVVKVRQQVEVSILDVDIPRKRISLTMKRQS